MTSPLLKKGNNIINNNDITYSFLKPLPFSAPPN